MTGKVWNLAPQAGAIRSKGLVHIYWSPYWQKWIARSWPKKRGKGTANQQAANAFFSSVVQQIKYAIPEDVEGANALAVNSPYLARDILMKLYTGTMFTVRMADGTIYESWRLCVEDIQNGLNTIGIAPGSMIYRDGDKWVALLKGDDGTIITIDSVTGFPAWKSVVELLSAGMEGEDGVTIDTSGTPIIVKLAPQASGTVLANVGGGSAAPTGVDLSDLLDFIGADDGDILYRSGAGWAVLPAGAATDVLTIDAITGLPAWEPSSGGGGGNTCIDLYSPPLAASFSTFTGDGTSPTLSDVSGLGMVLDSGASNSSLVVRGAVEAIPGSHYTITARCVVSKSPFNFRQGGICITDGTKIIIFGFNAHSGAGDGLSVGRFNNAASFDSNQFAQNPVEYCEYLQVIDDGSHRTYSISRDGRNWSPVFVEASGAFLTASHCGLFTQPFENDSAVVNDHVYVACPFWGATSP